MHILEENLLLEMDSGNKKRALFIYKNLFKHYLNDKESKQCPMKRLKNYLICLNCILYKNILDFYFYKEELFSKRIDFINKIEDCKSISQLDSVGEYMISIYFDLINISFEKTENPIVNRALSYIHNNLDQDITLELVADSIHISKSHLSSLFRKVLNTSFSSYISGIRIERAKNLLKGNQMNLVDIAFQCGFNSQSYFCYTFKKLEGVSPMEYQKK